jgi:hypothetical protein
MAWTKIKIAIAAGFALLLAVGITLLVVTHVKKAAISKLQGAWEGTLDVKQIKLRLVLKVLETNGTFRATLDSVDQGRKDFPVTELKVSGDEVSLQLPALFADYRATLNSNLTGMNGVWQQARLNYPLVLKKTTTPATVPEPMAQSDFAPKTGSDLQGEWEGTLKVQDIPLRLNLRVAEPSPGEFNAELDSVDQGVKHLPVTTFSYQNPNLRFKLTGIGSVFEGKLTRDEISGTWAQGGRTLPLAFRRAKASAGAALDFGQGASHQAQGHWAGTLSTGNARIHLLFHIGLLEDGSYSTTMDSPDQGAMGIPATTTRVSFPTIHLEWKPMGAVFDGSMKSGKLSGYWRQGAASLPLVLERERNN